MRRMFFQGDLFMSKFLKTLFVSYFIVSIKGTGTDQKPYEPDVPMGVGYAAYIPSLPDGRPKYTTCVIAVSDKDAPLMRNMGAAEITKTADVAGKVYHPGFQKRWLKITE